MELVDSNKLLSDLDFCVIDLETTGGNHQKDRIIEIGMVKVRNKKISDTKSFLINPMMPIPDFIQKLTNISQSDVKDCQQIEELIDTILEFIGEDIIVAHNTSFDVPFLNSVLTRLKKAPLTNKVICTNVMTKHLIPEILNSNLNYMSRLFNIDHSKAHRAEDDAMATAKLLIIFLDIFIEKGIRKINQLYYPRNKFELDRVHFEKKTSSTNDVIELIKRTENSILLTIKGERGLILAVLPMKEPHLEWEFAKEILESLEWELLTIKLLKPFIEGIFQFNNHFLKYSEDIREKILSYLNNKYLISGENKVLLENLDFIISHHLIADQVLVYSFLHLNTNSNTRSLFKIPAQKKKLYQYLLGQINRFETNQKGRRKHMIHAEIVPLAQSILREKLETERHLYLDRKDIKNDKDGVLSLIERFAAEDRNSFNFPTKHL